MNVYPIHRWTAVARLTPAEEEALVTLGDREFSRGPGETIRMEGDIVSGFYLHISGWVASSVTLPSGARLIQKIHLPGDMLGTTSMVLSRAADTLTAITQATVAYVPFKRLSEFYTRLPRLGALFTYASQVERLALMDALVAKGRASAKEQLARLFLDLHARLTRIGAVENDGFDLPLTQGVIADLTGLTAVHVSRKLRELRDDGLIARDGRRIQILDLEALRDLSPMSPQQPEYEPAWLPPAR